MPKHVRFFVFRDDFLFSPEFLRRILLTCDVPFRLSEHFHQILAILRRIYTPRNNTRCNEDISKVKDMKYSCIDPVKMTFFTVKPASKWQSIFWVYIVCISKESGLQSRKNLQHPINNARPGNNWFPIYQQLTGYYYVHSVEVTKV